MPNEIINKIKYTIILLASTLILVGLANIMAQEVPGKYVVDDQVIDSGVIIGDQIGDSEIIIDGNDVVNHLV